jgi:hypothetical protein
MLVLLCSLPLVLLIKGPRRAAVAAPPAAAPSPAAAGED